MFAILFAFLFDSPFLSWYYYGEVLYMHRNCKVKNLIFEITNACNFRCEYCFEDNGQLIPINNMEFEVVQKAVDRYISTPHIEYMVTFFGGEPLIGFSLIEKAVDYINAKVKSISSYVSYNIVTNGSLLNDQIIHFFCQHSFYVFFSYDGNKYCQNKYRRAKNGGDSDDIVVSNLQKLIQAYSQARLEDNLVVRMTITGDTISSLTERYTGLVRIGCKKITFALVSSSPTARYAITENVLASLRKEYLKLSEMYVSEIANGTSHNRFFQSLIYKIAKGYSKNYFCECGNAYIGVGADGALYPCEGFFGNKDFIIGNVFDEKNANSACSMHIQTVEENDTCSKCWAKFLCGGGCYQENYLRTSDINQRSTIMCETYRLAAEVALLTYYNLREADLLEAFLALAEEKVARNAVPNIDLDNVKIVGSNMFVSRKNEFIHIELDSVSNEILQYCDGKNTVQDIVCALAAEFEENQEVIYSDVSELFNRFMEYNIIFLTL